MFRFFSSRRRHTRYWRDWSSDVCSSDLDRMLDEDWDLVVVLTDAPLKDGRNPVLTQLSPVHGVGLVAVPALGAVRVPQKVRSEARRVGKECRSRWSPYH